MAGTTQTRFNEVAGRFALLSDGTRLRILGELHSLGEATVTQLATAAETTVANTSRHLRRLSNGGLVDGQRIGRTVIYTITEPTVMEAYGIVGGGLTENSPAAN